jgi:hypothetical protein
MLLTIAVGALSVAGVMASAIFRIGSKRRRSRRRQIWDDRRAPPWDSAAAKRPSPQSPAPAYRHPRELPDRTNPRRRPRPADGPPNDRVADFYGEIPRRRAPS